jgi:uncharacterized protein (TIGR00255 family)
MTGFASAKGALAPYSWGWELRSVNAKGLDLRLRVPDWVAGLEAALRPALGKAAHRGNVNLTLRVARDDAQADLSLNPVTLAAVLDAMQVIETEAMDQGLSLAPSKASDILALRGVLEQTAGDDDTTALAQALLADAGPLIAAFQQMRADEGAVLDAVLRAQLNQIETLTAEAAELAQARISEMADTLKANLARVLDNTEGADPARVAQELAMLAVKADVTEEIDRLGAHILAARALLDADGSIGRKLDFLMQEFNREANTLCSKSQSTDLTSVGLSLKAVIDQMREQVQNVE